MSYDLIFLNSKAAPSNMDEFQDWLDQIDENDAYGDSSDICAKNLAEFYTEFSKSFPDFSSDIELDNESYFTDYIFAENIIEANFSFSVCDEALKFSKALASKYSVAIYDLQDGEVLKH